MIHLPAKVPAIAFTHQFAKCNDLDGNMNDHLKIEYLNQFKDGVHYMMRLNPIEHKLKVIPHKKDIITTYKLKDGSKAVFGTTPEPKSFNLLVFEKGSWQYILSVDQRMSDIVTAEVFVQIAESLNGVH
ncbi:hypothetical protein PMSD_27750 [Paenibacillus macquariensis subsp. defensor]|nr:hypothetical protein PMSD_27750 [Paenibacillus macquariensis subsp. defensor]